VRLAATAFRKKPNPIPITQDQGLLLGSTPAFDLPFGGDGVGDTVEMF
jgi:hypothetical protein